MLRKGLLLAALCLLPAAAASAQVRGPWEVTLSASASNPARFNGFQAGGNASLGYFFGDSIEVSARQSFNYSDVGGVSSSASTRVAVDLHLPLGDQNQFLPFAGANLGYVYGHSVRDTWEAAPEAGIKWFVGPDVFIYGEIEYQFFFRTGSAVNNGFKNGEFVYGLGVGFRF